MSAKKQVEHKPPRENNEGRIETDNNVQCVILNNDSLGFHQSSNLQKTISKNNLQTMQIKPQFKKRKTP